MAVQPFPLYKNIFDDFFFVVVVVVVVVVRIINFSYNLKGDIPKANSKVRERLLMMLT